MSRASPHKNDLYKHGTPLGFASSNIYQIYEHTSKFKTQICGVRYDVWTFYIHYIHIFNKLKCQIFSIA